MKENAWFIDRIKNSTFDCITRNLYNILQSLKEKQKLIESKILPLSISQEIFTSKRLVYCTALKINKWRPRQTSNLSKYFAIEIRRASNEEKKKFFSVIGLLLHVSHNTRIDTINPIRECASYMRGAKQACKKHRHNMCEFIVTTKDRGVLIQPDTPNT